MIWWKKSTRHFWKLLPDPLMRPCTIEVGDIPIEHALELLLVEDQEVVEAFLSDTPQEAFADRIGSGSVRGGVEKLNRTCCRHTSEARPKFAVVITNQILRSLPKRGGFSKLLCHPGIGRGASNSNMDHPSCLEFDEEECEERSKEEIRHLQEVAGPDIYRVIAQKGRPFLPSWLGWANASDVLVDGLLAHMKTQFQEFPSNPFRTPEAILYCHLPD